MRIGELSWQTGVSQRLLRYYEERGLLDVRRDANGYRSYGADAVLVVRQIRALLGAGLSTEIIKSVLPCARGEEPKLDMCPELVRTLHRELAAMDARIDALRQARSTLAAYMIG